MGGLRARYERLPKPIVYAAVLAAVGVGYLAALATAGPLPSMAVVQPYLAAGILLGFAADRLLGEGGLGAAFEGTLFTGYVDAIRTHLATHDPTDVVDWEARDGDDTDSGIGVWTLYSIGSVLGITSWLEFTAPWFVGLASA